MSFPSAFLFCFFLPSLPSHAFHEWRQTGLLAAARMRQQFFLGCPPSLLKGRYRVSNSSSWLDTLEISGQSSKQVNQLVFVSKKTLFDRGANTSGRRSLLCLAQSPNGPTLRSPTTFWRRVNGPCPAGEYKTKTIRFEIHPNELIQVQPQWGGGGGGKKQ